jgi:hypothetical protein
MRAVCKGPRCLRQASAPDIAHDRMPCYVTEGSRHVVAGNAGNVGDVIQRDLGGEMAKDLRYRVRQRGRGSGRASLGRRAGPRDPLSGCSCSHRHVARCFAKSKIPTSLNGGSLSSRITNPPRQIYPPASSVPLSSKNGVHRRLRTVRLDRYARRRRPSAPISHRLSRLRQRAREHAMRRPRPYHAWRRSALHASSLSIEVP